MSITIPIISSSGAKSTVTLADPVVVSQGSAPLGPPGAWALKFEDLFTGTSLNTSVWEPYWYYDGLTLNNTPVHASNVAVSGGELILTMPNSNSGACITTRPSAGRAGFKLARECVFEARCLLPGDGVSLYNWPTFWVLNDTSGQQGVEMDIAEPWDGVLEFNYHCGSTNVGYVVPGYWGGYHVYTCHRKATTWDIYIDGVLKYTFNKASVDDGLAQYILLNVGRTTSGNHNMYGPAGAVHVDYVRAWQPA